MQFQLVCKLQSFLSQSDFVAVIQDLVTKCLAHFSELYVWLPLKILQKLQLLQNAMARLSTNVNYRDHMIVVLEALH